jgi:S-adenosylmethionine uptake transporter
MVVASFLFACMGVCVKLAAGRYSAAEIVFYRSAISLALMSGLIRLRGVPMRTPYLRLQLTRGAVGFVSLLLFFYAIALLPLATAVTLNYTSPLFLAAFLTFAGAQRPRGGFFGVLLTGFVGVAILLQPTLSQEQWLGGLIGLGSGIGAGLAYYNVRELGERGEPETRTVFYFALVSSVGAILWMQAHEFHRVDLQGGLLLLGVGVFATLAQMAMTRAYRRGRAMVSASLAYSAVVFASLFGVIFWGEHLGASSWLAIALVIASGIAATRVARANPAEAD